MFLLSSSRSFKRSAFRNYPEFKPTLTTQLPFHVFWTEQVFAESAASEAGGESQNESMTLNFSGLFLLIIRSL